MISLPNIPTLFRAHSQAVNHMSGDVKHVVLVVVDSELDISLNTTSFSAVSFVNQLSIAL
jgi:hypothetical protein